MTERSAAALPDIIEGIGVLFLWLVILIRAVPALRQPHQRTMWIAVLCGACAMTLRIDPIYDMFTRLTGLNLGANRDITADIIGLFAAAAIFAFILNVVGKGHYSRIAYGIALTVAITLALINQYYHARTSHALSQHSTAGNIYWLVLLTYHLVANFWCAYICWRCAPRTHSPNLKAALFIFAAGTTMAGVLMVLSLIHYLTGIQAIVYLFPIAQGAEAFLYGLGTAVPLIRPLWLTYRETALLAQIYPLWRHLADNITGITLTTPQHYLSYLGLSRSSQSRGLYRRVIETQDGILKLYRYVDPEQRWAATQFVHTHNVAHNDIEAAATACCITAGLHNKSAGQTPLQGNTEPSQRDTNLLDEATYLARVAHFHRSPLPREFIRDHPRLLQAQSHPYENPETVRN